MNDSQNFFCRICKNAQNNFTYKVKETRKGTGNFFDYVFCKNCNSLSIHEIPNNLSFYYKDYYSFEEIEKFNGLFGLLKKLLIKISFYKLPFNFNRLIGDLILNNENDYKLKSLLHLKLKKNCKILDIGCGTGDFVYYLHELGYKNSIGIDPFLDKPIVYENGAEILNIDIFEVKDKFDLITFHHSFEHLEKIEPQLDKVKKILSKDGTCLIRFPDIDCLSFKLFKENWVGIHAPYHTILPSNKGLEIILKKAGLKIQSKIGEQIIEFFLMSQEIFLGIEDKEANAIRSIMKKKGKIKQSPWHCKKRNFILEIDEKISYEK